jgi:putative MATE family efflux protein
MAYTEDSNKQKSLAQRDWTQGSIFHNLLLLSWPMVLLESMFMISQVVDMIWIGRLGPDAIAGVGVASIIVMLVMSMDFGLIVGVRAMVARFVGANDIPGANHIAAQSILLGVVWGGMMMMVGLFAGEAITRLFGLEEAVIQESMAYIRVMFYGWIALDINVLTLYIIQSAGDTIRPMWIEAFARLLHVILCPLLVLGLWIFPQIGVKGAALSNVIAQVVGMVIAVWLLSAVVPG